MSKDRKFKIVFRVWDCEAGATAIDNLQIEIELPMGDLARNHLDELVAWHKALVDEGDISEERKAERKELEASRLRIFEPLHCAASMIERRIHADLRAWARAELLEEKAEAK